MSNAADSKYRKVPASAYVADSDEDELYEDDYADEEAYDDDGAVESSGAGSGLFSSPARTITLLFSILLLFVMAGVVAWLLGQSNKPPDGGTAKAPQAVGSLVPVAQVSDPNAAYSNLPAGLDEAPRIGSVPP